jgi:hypothetical protein
MMAADLPAAVRGTAHVGAARCLLALDRRDEATAVLQPAAQLLARWGGWRVRSSPPCATGWASAPMRPLWTPC